jgi:hypothetical protein
VVAFLFDVGYIYLELKYIFTFGYEVEFSGARIEPGLGGPRAKPDTSSLR